VGNAYLLSGLAEWRIETVTDLEWSPDGLTLAVSDDSEIFLYGVHLREILRTLHPQLDGIVDIEISPNGRWLMSGSRNGSEDTGYRSNIEMWYGPDWKPLGVRYGAAYGLSSLAFSPNSVNFLAAFSSPVYEENYVDIWNTTNWQITSTLSTGTVLDIGVSRDSILLASTPDRYAIRIWDFDENSWLYKLYTSFTGAVNTIAFSPAGLILASGHYDGVVRIWDMVTGEQIQKMESDAVVQSLAFSPDGRLLATGGSYENGLVRIWDVQTGELLRILEGHPNGVSQVSFSPNSQFLVSGSYDGTLRIWGIRP
jgi:WD40 repeat protein